MKALNRLNFNHLFYFYIVAKEGSIKSASQRLHVSQPTISDQIKLLEEHFSCRLFERKNRALFLTQEGKLALKYSEQIFDMAGELTYRLKNKIEMPKTSLDIGMTYHMSQYFLYDMITPLFDQKNVQVKITQNERHLLLAELEEGRVDIVFTDDKSSLSSSMSAYRVGLNRTFAICHKKSFQRGMTFPECLNSIPFFNYTNNSFLKFEIEMFFAKNNLTPRVIGEADDIDLFQVVVEQSLAFVIVPEVAKNRLTMRNDIVVLGELEELQTSVWGVVKNSYEGPGFKILKK